MKHLLFLLFLCPSGLFAQQYNFINYSVEEGLAQSQVYDITQDNSGYLWFATTAGLSRFDGYQFVNFSQRDGLYRNQVNDLFLDNTGKLWIATIGGVSYLDEENFKSISFGESLEASKVNCLEQDQTGKIWAGTSDSGIVIIDDGSLERFTEGQGLLHNTIRSIYSDEEGVIWIGTKKGVNYVRDGGIYTLDAPELIDASISHITGDNNKGLWIATFGKGVFHVKGLEIKQITSQDGLKTDWIKQTIVEEDKVWFTSKFGVHEFKKGKLEETYTLQNGLPFEDIKCLLFDDENNLWLGSNGQGAFKFSGKAFVNYMTKDGLSDDIILSIQEDQDGRLWLGTYSKGVIILDPSSGKVSPLGTEDTTKEFQLSDNKVWSGKIDSKNRKWIGTALGLNLVTDTGMIVFKASDDEHTLDNGKITTICESEFGSIWVGMRTGIALYLNNGTFKNFTNTNGFSGSNIRSIVEDQDNNLWCGADNGLFKFNPRTKSTEKITLGSELKDVKVLSLAIDRSQRLWVGTDNGLFLKTSNGFKYISTGQDVRSNFVNFLLSEDGILWIGTNYGIYSLAYFNDETYRIKAFTNHEGIKNLECNLNAAFKDSKGFYWFGTAGGLVRLDKSLIREPISKINKVSLREIQLFNEETNWQDYGKVNTSTGLPLNLNLSHGRNTLSFDFILFNYSNPENVVYSFFLEGFDDAWSPSTKESFAVYRKLPPGEYTFKVKAKTSSGEWTKETTFSFTIDPPFWQTTWFFTLCAIALICLVIAFVLWRKSIGKRKTETEQLKFRNKLLALEHQSLNASLNRHFIFNALNSIQYYINRQDRVSANKYLSSFAKLIRKNLDSASSGNNYVTLSEELERTELYLSLEHMRFANKFEYEIKYIQEIDTEAIMIPAMLLQPFIENSIWHGILPMETPGKISITIDRMINGDIKFEIMDNGLGIDVSIENKKSADSGHDSKGMKITSGRISLLKTITQRNISLKGPFQINDENGKSCGTKVEIIIPSNTMETFF